MQMKMRKTKNQKIRKKVMMKLSSTVEWRNRRMLLMDLRMKCVGSSLRKDMLAFASNYCPTHTATIDLFYHIPNSTIE